MERYLNRQFVWIAVRLSSNTHAQGEVNLGGPQIYD